MTALIVDDEPLARLRLRSLLKDHADVVVVGECGDGGEASELIASTPPEVLFLDIRMPRLGGLELARVVGRTLRPLVVLVTAHAEHALEAFECRVVDYLLKPVRPERLAESLERLRDRLRLKPTLSSEPGLSPSVTTLMVRNGETIALVPVSDIEWIESAGNYLVIHTPTANHVLRATLSETEAQLDPERFIRISRSTLVNATCVTELHVTAPGQYEAVLVSGHRLRATRSLRELRESWRVTPRPLG